MDKHTIVMELKRLAEELGHPPSREDWRKHSKISTYQLETVGLTFREALVLAGMKEKALKGLDPEEKKYLKQKKVYSHVEDMRKKFEQEITPYVGKYDRDLEIFSMMVRSDDHAQWVDPWCDEVFWDVARRMQPEVLVFDGDTTDFWQVSSHSKNPRRAMTMQSEIDFVVSHLFKRAREVCPNAQIDWLLGNHEARLFRYLCDQAPALSSLKCLQFDNLFSLKDFEINLVARPSFLNARLGKDLENYKIYNNAVAVTHGTSTGEHPAHKELQRFGMSGVSGHVHRHTVASRRDLRGMKTWITNGAMCQLKSGDEYIPDLVNWNQGFTNVHVHRSHVAMEYADLSTDLAVVGGTFYKRKSVLGERKSEAD